LSAITVWPHSTRVEQRLVLVLVGGHDREASGSPRRSVRSTSRTPHTPLALGRTEAVAGDAGELAVGGTAGVVGDPDQRAFGKPAPAGLKQARQPLPDDC